MFQKIVSLNLFLKKLPGWAIFCSIAIIWFVVQYYYFQSNGVRTVPDSIYRYIPYARQVAESSELTGSQENRYLIYILLLAFFFKTKVGLTGLIFFQITISGVAVIYFYKTVKHLTNGNRLMAFGAALLMVLWKDIQYLNVYILTESLFTSSIIFVFYALVRIKTTKDYLAPIVLSIIPTLLRPNGFIVLLCVLICLCLLNKDLLNRYKWVILSACSVIITMLVFLLDRQLLTTFQIVETYARGEVIYASNIFSIKALNVVLPTERESPILRILYFIFLNPLFFFKLFFLKLFVFVAYIKPYYSIIHNLSIVLVIYPLYFFTGWFTFRGLQYKAISTSACTVFALQSCIVAATSEDWDSRFIIPLLPVIIAFGTAGLNHFLKQKGF